MIRILMMSTLAIAALTACSQTEPTGNTRLDASGTHYESAEPSHPVNNSMRNSTVNAAGDRMSGKYPVGSATGSNPY